MAHIVSLPNGQSAEFPDNMSPEQISTILQKQFPLKQAGPEMIPGLQNVRQPEMKPQQEMTGTFLGQLPKHYQPSREDINKQINATALGGVPNPFGFLGSTLKAAQSIPLLGNALQTATAGMKQAIPNALTKLGESSAESGLLGAAQNPEDKMKGFVEGAALGAGGHALGEYAKPAGQKIYNSVADLATKAGQPIKSFISKFTPEKFAGEVTNKLGGGATTSDEAAASLAKDFKNAHNMREAEASAFFEHPLKQAGHEEIYKTPNPLITTAMDKAKDITDKMKDLNIGGLYNAFKAKPSFQNAHNLQSELGVIIRDLQKNPHRTIAENHEIGKIEDIRSQLKGDINDFLEKRDLSSNENLAPSYKKGSDLYFEHVTPYLAHKKGRELVRGGKTIVKNIHSIFDTPYNIENRFTGEITKGPVNKLMEDLPLDANNKILFSAIGGHQKDANALLEALNKRHNKGFSSYFTPELKQDMAELAKKTKYKNRTKTAAKIGATALGASALLGGGATANKLLQGRE